MRITVELFNLSAGVEIKFSAGRLPALAEGAASARTGATATPAGGSVPAAPPAPSATQEAPIK